MISLCMIVRDEEKHLGRCLASVSGLVNEIIIVDTGSKDRTNEVARQFNSKILYYNWTDDFAAARNFGLEQAKGEWILVLDGDEYLEESTAHRISALTDRPDAPDAYLLPIRNLMIPELGEWQVSLVLRLFKNTPAFRFRGKIQKAAGPKPSASIFSL